MASNGSADDANVSSSNDESGAGHAPSAQPALAQPDDDTPASHPSPVSPQEQRSPAANLSPDSPVEMEHLSPHQPAVPSTTASTDASAVNPTDAARPAHLPPPPIPTEDTAVKGKESARNRAKSEPIGPSIDDAPITNVLVPTQSVADAGPYVLITIFLLNGNRHPFRLDQRYLKKRNVTGDGDGPVDPFGISIYTLKELIWRDWRDEWEIRPTNPGAIRLIFFGKLLDDKQTLKDARFNASTPNVVHMTVKPQEFMDDEENAKGERSSTRGTNARWDDEGTREAGCCRCSVM